jgi:signal transduction histidine kinase/AmiR/NasT family two-component response regulator
MAQVIEKLVKTIVFESRDLDFARVEGLLQVVNSESRAPEYERSGAPIFSPIVRAVNQAECLDLVKSKSYGLVLVSSEFLDNDATLMGLIKDLVPHIPIIVLSDSDDAHLSLNVLRQGGQDFLEKTHLDARLLGRSLRNALARSSVREGLSEESRHKSAFLARMSHEIRTPITAIIGFAEVILEADVNEEERMRAGQTILRNSKFLLGLIDDILDFSLIESGKFEIHLERVSLFEVLQDFGDLIRPRAEGKGLRFEVQPLFPLPEYIQTDSIRLEQVLVNLAGNAVKFCKKGSVTVSVHLVPETQKLVFHVKDTGIGIERGRLELLFDPFVQADDSIRREFGGTGLGLAISRSLVEALGGEISATSQPGVGSDFTFMIDAGPVRQEELILEVPSDIDQHARPEYFVKRDWQSIRGTVLVAEDVKDTQDLIVFYLKRAGASCTVVTNGADAVRVASEREFDLILMDMQMPIMDGFEAVRWLRTQGYSKPIVALTASATEESRRNCLAAGCNDHLTKPFSRDLFIGKISTFLPSSEGETLESRLETLRTDPSYLVLVDSFREGLPDRLMALNDAWQGEQLHRVCELAHRLASAEMFGFAEITRIARLLEDATKAKSLKQVEQYLYELSDAVHAAVRYDV